jgi:hypothetical protein
LAAAILAWAWITLGMQVLGELGHLRLPELAAWVAGGALIAFTVRGHSNATDRTIDQAAVTDVAAGRLGVVVPLTLVLWACFYLALISLLLPVKVVSDGPIYHLFFAARWWKEARLFLVPVPFGESAAAYFPANGDLWFAWLFVVWGGDRLARIGQAPFLLLAAATTYAMARRLGARASASMLATAWFVTVIPLLLFSFEANVDTIFIAGYLSGFYFLMLYAKNALGREALLFAGLALGLAWGTKPTATVFVPPLVILGLCFVVRRRSDWRDRLLDALLFAAATILPCAYWFGRNLWLTGNPLYPLHLEVLGRVWLRGWYDSRAMALSQFYIPGHIWPAAVDILVVAFDPRLVPIWVACLLGAWQVGRNVVVNRAWVWGCALLAVLNIALYWLCIPYRTQQRFMLQAAGLAAVPLAIFLDRSKLLRAVGIGLLAIHLVTPSTWPFFPPGDQPPWSLTRFIPVNIDAPLPIPLDRQELGKALSRPGYQPYLALRLALLAACFPLAWIWTSAISPQRWGMRLAAVGAMTSVLLSFAVWMYWGIQAFQVVYPPFDYYNGWMHLELVSGSRGTRVAYAGTNLPFYLMGKDLRNDVVYVNVDEHPGWLLHDYHQDAVRRGEKPVWDSPRPGWDRLRPNFRAWVENLRREGIRVLVVARVNRADGPFNQADREGFPIERVWADAHPSWFIPLYGVDPVDPLFKIYSVRIPPGIATDSSLEDH